MITWEHYRACIASTHVFHFSPVGTSLSFISVQLGHLCLSFQSFWDVSLAVFESQLCKLFKPHKPALLEACDDLVAIVHAVAIALLILTVSITPQSCKRYKHHNQDAASPWRQHEVRGANDRYVVVRRHAIQKSTNHFCFLSLPLEVAIFSDSESNSNSDSEDGPGDKY